MEESKQELALEFLGSMRGQYIMGQALNVAIKAMESVEPSSHREQSNIDDMRFLRDNLFSMGAAMASVSMNQGAGNDS
tara:strand:+ start:119 stop:352 length:234 start_codon:yes stop_codon:yes gene_type:complete